MSILIRVCIGVALIVMSLALLVLDVSAGGPSWYRVALAGTMVIAGAAQIRHATRPRS